METNKTTVSEYKIGHTTYLVKTKFNLVAKENLSDILKRLILRECEIIGQTGQEPEKQAV
ncbi:MAG: hypothetical protein ACI4I9_03225 [Porcipelethomonas sp.]